MVMDTIELLGIEYDAPSAVVAEIRKQAKRIRELEGYSGKLRAMDGNTLVRELESRAEKAEAELARVREALRWLINVECGVGKRGEEPEEGEREAAIRAGQTALEGKG